MSSPGQLPPYLRTSGEGVCLSVKVQPRASRNEITGALGEELKIKVTAPPVDSAANESLIEFLAETLELSKNSVVLLRGATSRHKVVLLKGISMEQAAAALTD